MPSALAAQFIPTDFPSCLESDGSIMSISSDTMTETPRVEEPLSPRNLRRTLGLFCSGLTVISAADETGPIGFTCQSFASLSLDPALVSFNPARTSTTWPRIRAVGNFCVNVLATNQEEISNAFAKSGADKFAGVHWSPAPSGAPILDGAIAWADCTVWAEYDGGDHTIVAAEIRALGSDATQHPLVFFGGKYGLPGPAGNVSTVTGKER